MLSSSFQLLFRSFLGPFSIFYSIFLCSCSVSRYFKVEANFEFSFRSKKSFSSLFHYRFVSSDSSVLTLVSVSFLSIFEFLFPWNKFEVFVPFHEIYKLLYHQNQIFHHRQSVDLLKFSWNSLWKCYFNCPTNFVGKINLVKSSKKAHKISKVHRQVKSLPRFQESEISNLIPKSLLYDTKYYLQQNRYSHAEIETDWPISSNLISLALKKGPINLNDVMWCHIPHMVWKMSLMNIGKFFLPVLIIYRRPLGVSITLCASERVEEWERDFDVVIFSWAPKQLLWCFISFH